MSVSVPYGAKGCRCWPNEDPHGNHYADWLPNAACVHHGILADYTAGRKDTGAYRVVTMPPNPPSAAEPGRWDRWGEWVPGEDGGPVRTPSAPASPPVTRSEEKKCRSSANRRGWRSLASRIRGLKGLLRI